MKEIQKRPIFWSWEAKEKALPSEKKGAFSRNTHLKAKSRLLTPRPLFVAVGP
tara:strand:+ start:979 stop:1137 length:159 start_codon:yes stop_codon:yes gene_type:complete